MPIVWKRKRKHYTCFLNAKDLPLFYKFLKYHLETLFRYTDIRLFGSLDFKQLMLLGYINRPKNMNHSFLNFFLSQARQSIYRRRTFFIQNNRIIDIVTFFKYSLQKNFEYIHQYYITKNNLYQFGKKFLRFNTLLKVENEKLYFIWWRKRPYYSIKLEIK